MKRRALALRALFGLFAVVALAAPASAADPPKKTTVHVRPEDMPAAEAAVKKASEGRKLLKTNVRAGVQMVDEALAELERTTGPDSPYSTTNRDVVIAVYESLKQPDKIKAVQARAEAARKKWSAPPQRFANENTGNALVKMTAGLEALKRNDFTKAAELLEQALPDVAKSDASEKMYLMIAGVLASLYDHSQQFAKGEALRKDVIAKMERSLGDSVEVGDQYESLATHYMMRADTKKALAAQKRAVDITRKTQPGSATLVDRLLTLASLQSSTGDVKTGEATLRETMGIVKVLRPVDPIRIVRVAHALATSLDTQLKNAEGDTVATLACEIATTTNHPDVLEEAEPDCIRAALVKKDTKTAGVLSAQRLARIEKRYGKSSAFYPSAAHELAQVRWAEG
ncbi:MAG TPA: hypothetical protein VM580_20360, partial [Labilithrix sp.]|nr:hypothetical protein [Labilithrix sp.]